jgi:hypothetical protein
MLVLVFLLLQEGFEEDSVLRTTTSLLFLGLLWLMLTLLTAIVAGTSLVGDRRRGFLELALMSSLNGATILDGTFLAVWEHVQHTYYLVLASTYIIAMAQLPAPQHVLCLVLTMTLFGGLTLVFGTVFSLVARTIPGALFGALAFLGSAHLGLLPALPGFARSGQLDSWFVLALLILALVGYVIGTRGLRPEPGLVGVVCYLSSWHVLLVQVGLSWMWRYTPVTPAQLVWASLSSAAHDLTTFYGDWLGLLLCYWALLTANIFLVRRWAIRHFDALAGRVRQVRPG